MALQLRKVTESQRRLLTPKQGEPLYIIDTFKLYVGDGITRGGVPITDSLNLLNVLDVVVDNDPIHDHDFFYWSTLDGRWHLGKRPKDILELEDVSLETDATEPLDLQILRYDATSTDWVVTADGAHEYPLANLTDIGTGSTAGLESKTLEYNNTNDNWDIVALPAKPDVGDMDGVTLSMTPERGHLLFNDPLTEEYINNYARQDVAPAYNCDLYDLGNLDVIKFSSTVGKFVKHTPTLTNDVPEFDLSGLANDVADPNVYTVGIFGQDEAFSINNERAHLLETPRDALLRLDLSNVALLGKTFAFSAQDDGTHSVNPVGTIFNNSLVTITGTPGIDGVAEIDVATFFETDEEGELTYEVPEGEDPLPTLEFTILDSIPDPDSGKPIPDVELEVYEPGLYYFCVEEPEFGAKIRFIQPEEKKDWFLRWDVSQNAFNIKRFDMSLASLGDVQVTPDEDGFLYDNQMLAYDSSVNKWTTPLDRVIGLGISSSLPRRFEEFANFIWAGGVEGLGSFDFVLPESSDVEAITIDLDELEVEGEGEDFDVFMFDTEEDRELFYELVDEAYETLQQTGEGGEIDPDTGEVSLSRQVIDDIASEAKAKKFSPSTRKKSYARTGKSVPPTSEMDSGVRAVGGGGGGGFGNMPDFGDLAGMMGGMFSGQMSGGGSDSGDGWEGDPEDSSEPTLDDLLARETFEDPHALAEEFKEAYVNQGNNVKKIIGAVLARRRAFDKLMPKSLRGSGDGGGGAGPSTPDRFTNEVRLKVTYTDVQSDPTPPTMFGWKASSDRYGYYYFTYHQRASALTYNTRDHELIPHSYLRRVGCTLNKDSTFKVLFYYDADDSNYIAGEWLRIVEWQAAQSSYNGTIIEEPSTTIRAGLSQWDENVLYMKGSRVIYNDLVWECLVRKTKGFPPASGTQLAPTVFEFNAVETFVEIPRFSVKSQVFSGVYQLRCTYGSNSFGGKTHPAFMFSLDPGDEADYVYVGANLIKAYARTDFNSGYYMVGNRDYLKTEISTANLDPGAYLYDVNLQSLMAHLMVSEFQTLNVEKRLGENNQPFDTNFTTDEANFAKGVGNGSGFLANSHAPWGGVSTYRGIHRPYGNVGVHIDGLNIDPATRETYYAVDNYLYNDSEVQPEGYTELHPLPYLNLDSSGNARAFISNFWNFERTDFSDFVFFLPKSCAGGRDSFLGDQLAYIDNSVTDTVPYKGVLGKIHSSPFYELNGAYGPHSLIVSPNPIAGGRLLVRRKGAALSPQTQGTGNTRPVGSIYNSDDVVVKSNIFEPDPEDLEEGAYWVQTAVIEEQTVIPGNDTESGKKGTRTMSLARLLLSRSALCIAVIDEADGISQSTAHSLWEEFTGKFPNRPFYLFGPASISTSAVSVQVFPTTVTRPYIGGVTEFTAPRESCVYDYSTFTGNVYTARRKIGSSVNYTEGNALSTATNINPGYESLFYGKYADQIFLSSTPFFPTSPNARASLPFTYMWGPSSVRNANNYLISFDDILHDYGVTPFNNNPTNFIVVSDDFWKRTYSVSYKIRIPAYTSSQNNVISDGLRIKFACNGSMNLSIYNPHTDSTVSVGSNSDPTSATTVTYTGLQVVSNFTPLDCHTNNIDLIMTVTYTPVDAVPYNTTNPLLWGVIIEVLSTDLGSYVQIFNTHDYCLPYGDQYHNNSDPDIGNSYDTILSVPTNFQIDQYKRAATVEGPYSVARDFSDSNKTTDWFTLANCQELVPGTLVGLFIDRSGSMTQSTVNASYSKFYSDCAAAGIEIVEVQNPSENWILPFIQEI